MIIDEAIKRIFFIITLHIVTRWIALMKANVKPRCNRRISLL